MHAPPGPKWLLKFLGCKGQIVFKFKPLSAVSCVQSQCSHLWHRSLITTSVTAHIQYPDFTLANISRIGFSCVYIIITSVGGGERCWGWGDVMSCNAYGEQRTTLESQLSSSTFTPVWAIGLGSPSAFPCWALSPAPTLHFNLGNKL